MYLGAVFDNLAIAPNEVSPNERREKVLTK
jgi:hypothetical protein